VPISRLLVADAPMSWLVVAPASWLSSRQSQGVPTSASYARVAVLSRCTKSKHSCRFETLPRMRRVVPDGAVSKLWMWTHASTRQPAPHRASAPPPVRAREVTCITIRFSQNSDKRGSCSVKQVPTSLQHLGSECGNRMPHKRMRYGIESRVLCAADDFVVPVRLRLID
jgi:hypothetical protein